MQKSILLFTNSAGALLLAMASALFVINLTSPVDAVQPHDPIFLLPLNDCFWVAGGIIAVIALICFFGEGPGLPLWLLASFSLNFWIYRLGLFSVGCHSPTGFLRGFSYAFAIPSGTAALVADIVFGSLLVGSLTALWMVRRLPPPTEFQKMSCQ